MQPERVPLPQRKRSLVFSVPVWLSLLGSQLAEGIGAYSFAGAALPLRIALSSVSPKLPKVLVNVAERLQLLMHLRRDVGGGYGQCVRQIESHTDL